jgi:hypothetical protein
VEPKAIAELTSILRREAQLLEALRFRLWSLGGAVTDSGGDDSMSQRLARPVADLADALRNLRRTELDRAMIAASVVADLDLDGEVPLVDIAAAVNDPWKSRLITHHDKLVSSVAEVDALAAEASHIVITSAPTRNDLANQLVDQAVPRSLVWFLRRTAAPRVDRLSPDEATTI